MASQNPDPNKYKSQGGNLQEIERALLSLCHNDFKRKTTKNQHFIAEKKIKTENIDIFQ